MVDGQQPSVAATTLHMQVIIGAARVAVKIYDPTIREGPYRFRGAINRRAVC